MPQKQSIPSEWGDHLTAFMAFASADELAKAHRPPRKMSSDNTKVWHYPLGVLAATLYAIHVAVSSDGVPVASMHTEPSTQPDTVRPSRPWWRLW